MGRPVLLTGASGLIGCHVRTQWIDGQGLDEELVTVDHSAVDLLDPRAAAGVIRQFRPSAVIHLAWSASGTEGYRHSKANGQWVESSLALVAAAGEVGAAIWATGTVLDRGPGHGDDYTAAKRDLRMRLEPQIAGGQVGWLRPFYVFDERRGRPDLVAAALHAREAGEVMRLRAPDNAHDFVHASDVASAVVTAVREGLQGEIDIGSGVLRTVADLVSILGVWWEQQPNASSAGQLHVDSVADIGPLRTAGWRPHTTEEFFAHE